MKSNLLFIALLFLGTMLSAQIFTEVRESDLINSTHGTVIFGDVNGDGLVGAGDLLDILALFGQECY